MVKKVRVQIIVIIIIIVTGRCNARGLPTGLLFSEEQKGPQSHKTRSCADNHTIVSHLQGRKVYFRIDQGLWKLWPVTRSRLRELDQLQTTSLLLQLVQIYFVIYLNFGINLYKVALFHSLKPMHHVQQEMQFQGRAGETIKRGIQCCPNFFLSFARPASLHCEEYVYMYIYMT